MIYFSYIFILSLVITINCDPMVFRDCGPTDKYIKYNSVSIKPYPIKYPGSVNLALDLDVIHNIEGTVMMKIVLEKLTPNRMLIPCIGDLGSCNYNFCDQALKSFSSLFQQFGTKCPITTGKYASSSVDVAIPTFGSAFDKVFEGNFEGNATFYDGQSNKVYGCAHLQFTVQL